MIFDEVILITQSSNRQSRNLFHSKLYILNFSLSFSRYHDSTDDAGNAGIKSRNMKEENKNGKTELETGEYGVSAPGGYGKLCGQRRA